MAAAPSHGYPSELTSPPAPSSAGAECKDALVEVRATAGTGATPQTPCSSEAGAGCEPRIEAPDTEEDEEVGNALLEIEQELTRPVPDLLETMNKSSDDVNVYEAQVSEAQERYRQLLDRWSRNYEQLRTQFGTSIDRARPYFDALQSLNAAKREVQGAAREFSAAASQHTQAKSELRAIEAQLAYGAHKVALDRDQQDGLSRATVRVLRCQQDRDQREQDYARVLREYQEAEEGAETWRAQIGETAIRKALPCFKQLQQHQSTLAAEQTRINSVSEKAKSAKTAYNHSLSQLDKISNSVHEARKSHAASVAASSSIGDASVAGKADVVASAKGAESENAEISMAMPSADAVRGAEVVHAKACSDEIAVDAATEEQATT